MKQRDAYGASFFLGSNKAKTTTSGIFGSGGFGFTIGQKSEKTTFDQNGVNQVASAVGSSNGKVSIASNKDIGITASDIIVMKGVDIKAADKVTIDAGYNTANSKQTYEFKQTGLSVSLVNAVQKTNKGTIRNH